MPVFSSTTIEQRGSPSSIMTLGRGMSRISAKLPRLGAVERVRAYNISLVQWVFCCLFCSLGRVSRRHAFRWALTRFIRSTRSVHSRVPWKRGFTSTTWGVLSFGITMSMPFEPCNLRWVAIFLAIWLQVSISEALTGVSGIVFPQ